MPLPLEGLLVVALEQAVAAPLCSCRLADAGARVIKIERPEGDFARGYDDLVHGECSYFVWLNRGKESVVLDLAKADDKAILAAMIAKADVFVQNLKPGAVAKLGFPVERLRREHPRLIACSVSAYGVFKTRDGADILISIQSDREWRALAEKVLGDKALAADPNFATNVERVKRRAETDGRVAAAFGAVDVASLIEKLAAADIAFGRVNGPAELATHPHLRRITIG